MVCVAAPNTMRRPSVDTIRLLILSMVTPSGVNAPVSVEIAVSCWLPWGGCTEKSKYLPSGVHANEPWANISWDCRMSRGVPPAIGRIVRARPSPSVFRAKAICFPSGDRLNPKSPVPGETGDVYRTEHSVHAPAPSGSVNAKVLPLLGSLSTLTSP